MSIVKLFLAAMSMIGLALLISMRLGHRVKVLKAILHGSLRLNALLFFLALLAALAFWLAPAVYASPNAQGEATQGGLSGTVALAAALSTGLATIGAGVAVGMTGSAALGTIAERPETFGRALIFVGLAEGIAIYGLIVSFLIISR